MSVRRCRAVASASMSAMFANMCAVRGKPSGLWSSRNLSWKPVSWKPSDRNPLSMGSHLLHDVVMSALWLFGSESVVRICRLSCAMSIQCVAGTIFPRISSVIAVKGTVVDWCGVSGPCSLFALFRPCGDVALSSELWYPRPALLGLVGWSPAYAVSRCVRCAGDMVQAPCLSRGWTWLHWLS